MCRQWWTLRVGAAWVGLLLLAAACASVPDTDSGFISESTFTSPPGGRPIVAPGEREGFRPFYSDQLHARVILPPGWVGVDGPEPLRPALPGMGEFGLGPGIAAFNSWGGGGFWAHAVPVGCCESQYGGQSVLDQLPEDGAYIVVTDDSATASHAYVEHESSYLTDLWPTSDCRSGDAAGGDNAASSTTSDMASDSTFVSPPDSTSDENASAKNNRTDAICSAAKAQGIIVFTIGFEAPYNGRTVLKNCASSDAHYFDVKGLEISEAFASIATSIRKLRLTQ